jgi:hypothetical protein
VKIRLKVNGASVQENGNELAPLACALTGQRSSGAPLGGNRWGAVGQPSAAPIARQNLVLTQRPFHKLRRRRRRDVTPPRRRRRGRMRVTRLVRQFRDAVVRRRRRWASRTGIERASRRWKGMWWPAAGRRIS